METVEAASVYQYRYGWYFRSSTFMYEFWWGLERKILLDAMMLDAMPTYFTIEVKASVSAKGSAGELD